MNEHDQRAQFREAPEPEEGHRATPKFVLAWIVILIVWGVGYYAWQIGKPLTGGDSRTPVASAQQPASSAEATGKTTASVNAGDDTTRETADAPDTESADATEAVPDTQGTQETEKPDDSAGEPEEAAASAADDSEAAAPDGAALFSTHCATCHQANGQGVPGAFPPLAGSHWLQGNAEIPVAIVHDGLQGKIEVEGTQYQGVMPAFSGQLSNAELAAVLTYARNEWGNSASEITADAVAKHEKQHGDRKAWTADELTEVFGEP